ncbi:MAG: beta-propeller fold lactonase family protein [Erysipelotrichaceae bacterium]
MKNIEKIGYVGTANEKTGIYQFTYLNGILSNLHLLTNIPNSKYLAKNNHFLYSLTGDNDKGGMAIIKDNVILDQIFYDQITPTHISVTDNYIYTCNYHDHSLAVLSFTDEKLHLIKRIQYAKHLGLHQLIIYKNQIIVLCLISNEILFLDKDLSITNTLQFKQNVGPRHGIIIGDYLYVVGEINNHLIKIDLHNLNIVDTIFLTVGSSAAIKKNNNYIFVSTRDSNIISVIDIVNFQLIKQLPSQGEHPRDFIVEDNYLIIANRFSNNIICLDINSGETTSQLTVDEAVCLIKENNDDK